MKYIGLLFIIICLSGCAIISKQYYYEPSVAHQTIKGYYSHLDAKMIFYKVSIPGKSGDTIGTINTSNGVGHPLLMGPLLFPVIPVGGFFQKTTESFMMELAVNCKSSSFMSLAIDSNDYKKKRDSLYALNLALEVQLNTRNCYLIANDTTRIPLQVQEFFMRSNIAHSYRLSAATHFRKIKTLRLVTSNALLDSTLNKITFRRKSRIKFDLIGPGY